MGEMMEVLLERFSEVLSPGLVSHHHSADDKDGSYSRQ